MRLHRHMEEGMYVVITDGAGYDCPPDRACWFEGPPEHLGREIPNPDGFGKIFVQAGDPRITTEAK